MGTMTNPLDPEVLLAVAIMRLLQADTAVWEKLRGRITVAEPAELRDEELPAMCFRVYGAGGDSKQGIRNTGMQVWSFSQEDYEEASWCYRLFRNVIDGVRLDRGGVYGVATEKRGPTWNYDQAMKDYTVTALWSVQYTEPVQD